MQTGMIKCTPRTAALFGDFPCLHGVALAAANGRGRMWCDQPMKPNNISSYAPSFQRASYSKRAQIGYSCSQSHPLIICYKSLEFISLDVKCDRKV